MPDNKPHDTHRTLPCAEAQQAHADVLQQVADLQEAFDTALTELDIARSLLANQQQQQQQQQRPESGQGLRQPEFPQHIVAFPMTLGALQTNQQVRPGLLSGGCLTERECIVCGALSLCLEEEADACVAAHCRAVHARAGPCWHGTGNHLVPLPASHNPIF